LLRSELKGGSAMSRSRMARKGQMLAAAAALAAGGLLTAPMAHAAACTVNGDNWTVAQPDGNTSYNVTVNANGSTFGPRAVIVLFNGTSGLYGDVTGSIRDDKTLAFTVTWDDSFPGFNNGGPLGKRFVTNYSGTIGPDGNATGSATGEPLKGANFNLGYVPGNWHSTAPLNCEGAAAGGTTAQKATVKQESDVYDAVSGNRIEAPFALPVGKQYDTVQPCADSWCLLKIPELPGAGHGTLPAKQGRVYAGGNGDAVFLQVA
jgi:hypothetical protein